MTTEKIIERRTAILHELARDLPSNSEIARRLHMTEGTVARDLVHISRLNLPKEQRLPGLREILAQKAVDQELVLGEITQPHHPLLDHPRKLEILKLAHRENLTTRPQIAQSLGVSKETIKSHFTRARAKGDVQTGIYELLGLVNKDDKKIKRALEEAEKLGLI